METAVASTIVQGTREEAEHAARADLDQLRRQALEAGRERSRQLIKVTRFGANGSIRHNPAGRILRDWYVHTYINGLRGALCLPHDPVDAQQVEDTARLLCQVGPASEPLRTLQAAGIVRRWADADASSAAAGIVERLRTGSALRAIRHAPDDRFDSDELRVHVSRHWYQRCYDTTVEEMVGARHPLAAITDGEQVEVARTMATGEARRLIGRDGIPLVTAHHTALSNLDRSLAAGEIGLVPVSYASNRKGDPTRSAIQRIYSAWRKLDPEGRAAWLGLADALPLPEVSHWGNLSEHQRGQLVRQYLGVHSAELLGVDFDRPRLRGDGADVARRMFNHREPLVIDVPGQGPLAREAAADNSELAGQALHARRGLAR